MKMTQTRPVIILALAGMALTAAALAVQEQAKPVKEEYSGNVMLVAAGPATGGSGRLSVTIERWSTDEEKAQLKRALAEGGSEGLLKALRKTTVGYVRTTQSLRYPLNFASSFQTEKGRTIRLVTERPILWAEMAGMTARSRDYEFGWIEFTMNEKGKGEGFIIPTAKVFLNKDGQLEVESLGVGPQKLFNVKKD
jgi:hypothetical protein